MAFDLERFRELAFGKLSKPDHAIADEADAQKMVAALPTDQPAKALAELTNWALSINEEHSFSPEQRGRILMQIDVAAHPLWRPLGGEFLAPGGRPSEGRDGDPGILHALRESAGEFANGYRLCCTADALKSRWVRDNLGLLALRRIRWHTRRMQFSRMLRLDGSDGRWVELHEIYRFAEEQGVFRLANKVFPGNPRPSSVKQEYLRPLLGDIARPDRFLGREFELMFRIIGRISASVQLETEPLPGALHAVVPEGSRRPVNLSRHTPKLPASALHIDISNAIPRLKALQERHMDLDSGDPDPAFGEAFTVRERRELIDKLLAQWTSKTPPRRGQRITLQSQVLLHHGYEDAAKALPALDQGDRHLADVKGKGLRIQLDEAEQKARVLRQSRLIKATLYDASTHGMGVVVDKAEARWAKVGALLALCVQPGQDWVVGVVRRANDAPDGLRLGVAVLAAKPRLLWFHRETTGYQSVWEEEKRHERNFFEHYQRGIVIDLGTPPLSSGELLLPAGLASRGTRFEVPLPAGFCRLVASAVREETHDFQRVAFERAPAAPAKTRKEN